MPGSDKSSLRRSFAARRQARSPHQQREATRHVSAALEPLVACAGTLLAYRAIGSELSLAPVLLAAAQRGLQAVCPTQTDCPWDLAAATVRQRRQAPTLVLLPGLAFDPIGTRLGRGAGFYDRLLSALPASAVRVGVGYACQLAPRLPRAPHDMPLDAFVCEKGLFLCRMARPAAARWLRAYCQALPIEAILSA